MMDGATGTNLFDMGLISGDAPELWNDEFPDRVMALNRGFAESGSDVILTNSFGANAMRLKLHNSEHRVAELNEKAAQIARDATERADRKVFVAGSMGPLGELIEPVGTLEQETATEAFADQALALERGGGAIFCGSKRFHRGKNFLLQPPEQQNPICRSLRAAVLIPRVEP